MFLLQQLLLLPHSAGPLLWLVLTGEKVRRVEYRCGVEDRYKKISVEVVWSTSVWSTGVWSTGVWSTGVWSTGVEEERRVVKVGQVWLCRRERNGKEKKWEFVCGYRKGREGKGDGWVCM